jgi:hypothetical protein
MEAWLQIVIRQTILYSLPVILSLSVVGGIEAIRQPAEKRPTQLFSPLRWGGFWWPLAASIAMHRAVIIAIPRPVSAGIRPAMMRFLGHVILAIIGWILYMWAIGFRPPAGIPPLHFWWAKVLMYFNLCMLAMHLLPLPGMVAGEWFRSSRAGVYLPLWWEKYDVWLFTLLAASPILDLFLGRFFIYPLYEPLASMADRVWH